MHNWSPSMRRFRSRRCRPPRFVPEIPW